MLKIQKVPIVGGGKPPSHTLPPLGHLMHSDDGASRRRIFDSYENTDFWAKILIFRCKNTENGKSNLAAGCENSDFNLISDFFALHKTPFSDF